MEPSSIGHFALTHRRSVITLAPQPTLRPSGFDNDDLIDAGHIMMPAEDARRLLPPMPKASKRRGGGRSGGGGIHGALSPLAPASPLHPSIHGSPLAGADVAHANATATPTVQDGKQRRQQQQQPKSTLGKSSRVRMRGISDEIVEEGSRGAAYNNHSDKTRQAAATTTMMVIEDGSPCATTPIIDEDDDGVFRFPDAVLEQVRRAGGNTSHSALFAGRAKLFKSLPPPPLSGDPAAVALENSSSGSPENGSRSRKGRLLFLEDVPTPVDTAGQELKDAARRNRKAEEVEAAAQAAQVREMLLNGGRVVGNDKTKSTAKLQSALNPTQRAPLGRLALMEKMDFHNRMTASRFDVLMGVVAQRAPLVATGHNKTESMRGGGTSANKANALLPKPQQHRSHDFKSDVGRDKPPPTMPASGGARLPDAPILDVARGERFLARDGAAAPVDTDATILVTRVASSSSPQPVGPLSSAVRKSRRGGVGKGAFSTAARFADTDPTRQRRAALQRGAEDCMRPQRLRRILDRQIEMEVAAAAAATRRDAGLRRAQRSGSPVESMAGDQGATEKHASGPPKSASPQISAVMGATLIDGGGAGGGGRLQLDPKEVGFTLTGLLHKDDDSQNEATDHDESTSCNDHPAEVGTKLPLQPNPTQKRTLPSQNPRNNQQQKPVEGLESGDDTDDVGRLFHKHLLRSRYGAVGLSVAAAGGRAAFAALNYGKGPLIPGPSRGRLPRALPALQSSEAAAGASSPPHRRATASVAASRLGVTAADLQSVDVTRDDAAYRGTTGTERELPGLPSLTSSAHAFGIDAARNFGDDAYKPVPVGLRVPASAMATLLSVAADTTRSCRRNKYAATPPPNVSAAKTTDKTTEGLERAASYRTPDGSSCQLPPLLEAKTKAPDLVTASAVDQRQGAELRDAFGLRHAGRLAAFLHLDPKDFLRAQRDEVRRTAGEMGAVLPCSPR